LPTQTDWALVIAWLTSRAVPQYVPDALRRIRAADLVDPELLTRREVEADEALRRFEKESAQELGRLRDDVDSARAEANELRPKLLYGTSGELVDGVAAVMRLAGFTVEDLDSTLGRGRSADLLLTTAGKHWLCEVRSASGSAPEDAISDLERHTRTWRELGRSEELSGGVVIINHQHASAPLRRDAKVFTRREFVDSLPYPVIPSLALFCWWRDRDFGPVLDAVTGAPRMVVPNLGGQ